MNTDYTDYNDICTTDTEGMFETVLTTDRQTDRDRDRDRQTDRQTLQTSFMSIKVNDYLLCKYSYLHPV